MQALLEKKTFILVFEAIGATSSKFRALLGELGDYMLCMYFIKINHFICNYNFFTCDNCFWEFNELYRFNKWR